MHSRRRVGALATALSFATAAAGILVAIAVNEATSQKRWPAPFHLIQDHPWRWALVSGAALVVLSVWFFRVTSAPGEDRPAIAIDRSAVRSTTAGVYHETNYFLGTAPASPAPVESPADDPDVPGLPEFVPITLRDREDELKQLKEHLSSPDGIVVQLAGEAGIGKTALAAAVLRTAPKEVARGYLAARGYPGVTASSLLRRLAGAIGDRQAQQLAVERLNNPDADLLTKLDRLLDDLGGRRVWMVLDDVQDLRDDTLTPLLHGLAERPGHRIKILVVTTDPRPIHSAARVDVVNGIPRPDFDRFLADLAIADTRDPLVGELLEVSGGHPRTAELVLGIRAVATGTATDPMTVAASPAELTRALLANLTEAQRRAIRTLAALDRPVHARVITDLGGEAGALDELTRNRLIRQYDDRYYLPAGEAGRITSDLTAGALAARRRRAAKYFADTADRRNIHRLDDLENHFHAIDLYVLAGEPARALHLMADIDETHLQDWGQTYTLLPWLSVLAGRLTGANDRVLWASMFARALAHQGKLGEAIATVKVAETLNEPLRSSDNQRQLLIQLAGYQFRSGDLGNAAATYHELLERAEGEEAAAARLGLAFCETHAGHLAAAHALLDGAATGAAEPTTVVRIRLHQALLNLEQGDYGLTLALIGQARGVAAGTNAKLLLARCDDLEAWVLLLDGEYSSAQQAVERAFEVAARVGNPDLCRAAGTTLAIVHLRQNHPHDARRAANLAARYARGLGAADTLAVRAAATMRCGRPADDAFHAALRLVDDVRPDSYRAYEAEGLALAGLALLHPADGSWLRRAREAYEKAIAMVPLPGAQRRRREAFRALAGGRRDNPLPGLRDLLD